MSANPARGLAVLSAAFPARKYFHFAEADGRHRKHRQRKKCTAEQQKNCFAF